METKFIEGANEQYSIREDGVVIRHCKSKNIELKCGPRRSPVIQINNINKCISVNKLLFKYFNYCICKKCKSKIYKYSQGQICDDCITKQMKLNRSNYRNSHKEYYSNNSKRHSEKIRFNLTRVYVKGILGISMSDLTDKLYEHHKNLVLFKRQVAKEHNIKIEKLR